MTVTKTSKTGSDEELAVPVEDGNDILKQCAGGCGKVVLFFGTNLADDWGAGVEGSLCLECRSKPLRHVPEGEKDGA